MFSHDRFNLFSLHERDHGDGTRDAAARPDASASCAAPASTSAAAHPPACMPRSSATPSIRSASISATRRRHARRADLPGPQHLRRAAQLRHSGRGRTDAARCISAAARRSTSRPSWTWTCITNSGSTGPDDRIAVGIRRQHAERAVDHRRLGGRAPSARRRGAGARRSVTIPAITAKVIVAIHWEALRLWLKGMRYRRKPAAARAHAPPSSSHSCNFRIRIAHVGPAPAATPASAGARLRCSRAPSTPGCGNGLPASWHAASS